MHSSCPLCGFGDDSNAHAIFWCLFSQEVWVQLEYPFVIGHKEEVSFNGVLMYATELLGKDDFEKMLVMAWGIWTERNRIAHGQIGRTPQHLKTWLTTYYEEVKNAQAQEGGATYGEALFNTESKELDIMI